MERGRPIGPKALGEPGRGARSRQLDRTDRSVMPGRDAARRAGRGGSGRSRAGRGRRAAVHARHVEDTLLLEDGVAGPSEARSARRRRRARARSTAPRNPAQSGSAASGEPGNSRSTGPTCSIAAVSRARARRRAPSAVCTKTEEDAERDHGDEHRVSVFRGRRSRLGRRRSAARRAAARAALCGTRRTRSRPPTGSRRRHPRRRRCRNRPPEPGQTRLRSRGTLASAEHPTPRSVTALGGGTRNDASARAQASRPRAPRGGGPGRAAAARSRQAHAPPRPETARPGGAQPLTA